MLLYKYILVGDKYGVDHLYGENDEIIESLNDDNVDNTDDDGDEADDEDEADYEDEADEEGGNQLNERNREDIAGEFEEDYNAYKNKQENNEDTDESNDDDVVNDEGKDEDTDEDVEESTGNNYKLDAHVVSDEKGNNRKSEKDDLDVINE